MKISVIIPVHNEAKSLSQLLASLQPLRAEGHEVIVVDGGSNDGSVAIAQGNCDKTERGSLGRARQMNKGASLATGNVLLFLHGDTWLPKDAHLLICRRLVDADAMWGRFDVSFSNGALIFRLIATMMNLRSRITGVATGDQAIFVRAAEFRALGGFATIALMEDVELSKRLRQRGRPVCLSERVKTSSRRWERHGIARTIFLMWYLRFLFFCRVSPSRLAAIYYNSKSRSPSNEI